MSSKLRFLREYWVELVAIGFIFIEFCLALSLVVITIANFLTNERWWSFGQLGVSVFFEIYNFFYSLLSWFIADISLYGIECILFATFFALILTSGSHSTLELEEPSRRPFPLLFFYTILAFFSFCVFMVFNVKVGVVGCVLPIEQLNLLLLKLFFVSGVVLSIWFPWNYHRQQMELRSRYGGEISDIYSIVVVFALLGCLLLNLQNFLSIFVVLIGFNICLYVLLAFSKTPSALEATAKYFSFGVLAVSFFLFGVFCLYCEYGFLEFSFIKTILGFSSYSITFWEASALIFLISSLGLKLGVFPSFLWAPDVYEGATFYIVSILLFSKLIIFGLLAHILTLFSEFQLLLWGPILGIFAMGSLFVGTFGAIMQQKLKRFLAFSSVNHVGFVLLAMSVDTSGFFIATHYLLIYLLANFILLGVFLTMRKRTGVFAFNFVSDLAGLFRQNRWCGWLVVGGLFSLAGIPPFLGFYTKYGVLVSALSANFWWGFLGFLVALLFLGFATFNYLRVIKTMLFRMVYSSRLNFIASTTGLFVKFILTYVVYKLIFISLDLLNYVEFCSNVLGFNGFISL